MESTTHCLQKHLDGGFGTLGRVGERRTRLKKQERDLDEAAPAPRLTEHKAPDNNLSGRVLSMQRTYGNAAVTAVVQRKGNGPQSTDAPGAKKKPPPKKEAPAEDYAPKEANPQFHDWSDAALNERSQQELKSGVKNAMHWAAEMQEELWFRHHKDQSAAYAIGVYRAYKEIGDGKREAFWLKVMHGEIKPGQPAQESQAGKEF